MDTTSLAETLLLEQQELTAVERFSQRHHHGLLGGSYQDLIPLTKPGDGEQYAFEVDLNACSGCKACVSACHSMNGLDPDESWRDVGLLHGGLNGSARQQFVTSACHHCVDPACANGCPTLAYEKDAVTGIVRHLDDQCMGCRYCELTCPYEVPKYNERLGIVRKCDMCQGRLEVGEAPACVQACPNEAIKIRLIKRTAIEHRSTAEHRLAPGTVPSRHTMPSTSFLNLREGPELRAADADSLRPAHAHWPLVWMLVMTQAGAGIVVMDALMRLSGWDSIGSLELLVGVVIAMLGLGGSALHLGRPLQGWRGVLGWRRSWLSREILAFGAWGGALAGLAASTLLGHDSASLFSISASMLGIVGVFCSVQVYAVTQRPFWSFAPTLVRFGGTFLMVGLLFGPFPWLMVIPLLGLLAYEASVLLDPGDAIRKSSRLMAGPLKIVTSTRWVTAIVGIMLALARPELTWLTLGVLLVSELAARALFFQAVEQPKMPGGLSR